MNKEKIYTATDVLEAFEAIKISLAKQRKELLNGLLDNINSQVGYYLELIAQDSNSFQLELSATKAHVAEIDMTPSYAEAQRLWSSFDSLLADLNVALAPRGFFCEIREHNSAYSFDVYAKLN